MQKSLLLIGNHLSASGQNKSVGEELAMHLEHAGYHALLVSRQQNKPARLLDMLLTILRKRRVYDLAEVDVFSGPAFLWAFLSARLLKLINKPIILTLHGGALPDFGKKHSYWVEQLLSSADAVVSPSQYLHDELTTYKINIQVIANGLDIENYPFHSREKPLANLVWMRAFHQIYDPSLAPKLLGILKNQGFEPHLRMVGPDKADGSLEEVLHVAQELQIVDKIEIIRGIPKEQVPDFLARGDIFINTTKYESFGVTVLEAAACGLCIVTTNVGELSYLWEDGIDALLVPPNDPQAMADAVIRVLTEPGLAARLSENARKKAERFDWSVILPQWEALFQSLQ
jgi:glycosyltransferase involved in cell wall biosynthesis